MAHCRENGVGALVISHDEALLARLCSRVMVFGGAAGGMKAARSVAEMESGEGAGRERAQAAGSAA
jgi:ABC-type dipeptide/oligopeptide/nickel transport system ATPase subunit